MLDVDEFLDAAGGSLAAGRRSIPRWWPHSSARPSDDLAALSAREREVLSLIAEGLTNSGIARRLVLTERTVESHVRGVL